MSVAPKSEPSLRDSDVIVIGGGPAGSTAAALLARRGWQVTLLEKGRHPRFHIGESLLPLNIPILERLGVLDQVAAIGVRKLAADFPSGGGNYGTFPFARALDAVSDHAFQVRRSEFDEVLFRNAQNAGANGVEDAEVLDATALPDGRHAVRVKHAGNEHTIHARYLIDASGRDTLFGRKLGLKQAHSKHRSAAMFGHYRGVERRPGEDAGNITIYRLPQGWMWMIPLRDDVMSVGAVCDPAHFKQRRGALEDFLLDTFNAHPEARARLAKAERVSDVEATGNYSYACREIAGRGWVMAGDAYAFVDPIFSSGVYLAMHSAENAAQLVDETLRTPSRERALQLAYRKRHDAGLRQFMWFIERFTGPTMRELFQNPRNFWQIEQAVISLLAGDVFDNPRVRRRLRVFRVIHALTWLRLRLRGGLRSDAQQAAAAGEALA
jgi:flavin-dependent dehydrogenase